MYGTERFMYAPDRLFRNRYGDALIEAIRDAVTPKCPTCGGSGKVKH